MAYVKTDHNNYVDIANAIRTQNFNNNTYKPAEMADAILKIKGMSIDHSAPSSTASEWVRPANYPDLDTLDLTNFNGVYLTYDLSKTEGYGWIGVYALVSSGKYKVERGHIENGEFIVDYTAADQASGAYFRQDLDPADGIVQLWRVYSATANITRVVFVTNTATNAQNKALNHQPCVERYGRLPGLTSIASSSNPANVGNTAGAWGTVWLEHDKIYDVTNLTTMLYAWTQCYNLRKIELPGWNITKVTTMAYAWSDCYSLQELDLRDWTPLVLTNMSYAWNECYSLHTLNIQNWTVQKVTTMGYAWRNCYSLKKLDLSNWETNSLTNLDNAWANCFNLESLNIKTLNTAKVTTLAAAWNTNLSLIDLDLEGWDLSACKTLASAWNTCSNLKHLKISSWQPTAVTTMDSAWNNCFSIVDLDIADWRPEALTTLSKAWYGCHSLRALDLSSWGLVNITNLASAWYGCYSLKELKTDNWRPAGTLNLNYAFYNCSALENIDISSWGNNLTTSNIEYITNACYNTKSINLSSLKTNSQSGNYFRYAMLNMFQIEYINMNGLDMPDITGAAGYPNLPTLIELYPPILYVNFSVNQANRLSRASLLRIINSLPEVTVARTCTLGQTNKLKLTAEEIAVATEKGWTIA